MDNRRKINIVKTISILSTNHNSLKVTREATNFMIPCHYPLFFPKHKQSLLVQYLHMADCGNSSTVLCGKSSFDNEGGIA